MRAGLAAEQRGEPLTRRADALFEQDGAFRFLDADLGFLLVHVHANIRHGWPALCGGIDCPGSGCRHAPLDDGTACGANDQCLLDAICQAGTCTGRRRDCSDGNQCTTDTCDPDLGCAHTALDCFDGVTCDLAPGLVDSSCKYVPLPRFARVVERAHALIDDAHDAVLTSPRRSGRLLVAASKALGRARSFLKHSHAKSGCAAAIKRLRAVQRRIATLHHRESLARCVSAPVSAEGQLSAR